MRGNVIEFQPDACKPLTSKLAISGCWGIRQSLQKNACLEWHFREGSFAPCIITLPCCAHHCYTPSPNTRPLAPPPAPHPVPIPMSVPPCCPLNPLLLTPAPQAPSPPPAPPSTVAPVLRTFCIPFSPILPLPAPSLMQTKQTCFDQHCALSFHCMLVLGSSAVMSTLSIALTCVLAASRRPVHHVYSMQLWCGAGLACQLTSGAMMLT